jgi:hypothetical protein
MLTFYEFVAVQEGLMIPDDNAIVGLSRIAPPKPQKPQKPQKLKPPPKLKPFHALNASESLDQLHRNIAALDRLGIGLFPPKKEDLRRLLDKYKNQISNHGQRPGY